MLSITEAQIADAASGDITAAGEIVKALTPRIYYVARDAATVNGHLDAAMADDYASEAKIAVFLCLPKFNGTTVGALSRYADRYIAEAISEARRREASKGVVYDVSDFARHTFERAMSKAEGDPHRAEEIAQSEAEFGKNALSPETAWRARIATQPVVSLDQPLQTDTKSWDDRQPATLGAAITYRSATTHVQMRFDEGRRVRSVLDELSSQRAGVLRRASGVGDSGHFGLTFKRSSDRKGNDTSRYILDDAAGIAADMGVTEATVKSAWNEGKKTFRSKWEAAYGERGDFRTVPTVDPSQGALSEEEAVLAADVEANPEGIRMKFHGDEVEFVVINDEGDAVCTWLSLPRAKALGLLEG